MCLNFFGITSQDPPELPAVLKYPPELHFLSISPPELSIALNLDPSVQIRAQNFSKRPKYPCLLFFKKIKKNILEVENFK
jgi:hypothetical protein